MPHHLRGLDKTDQTPLFLELLSSYSAVAIWSVVCDDKTMRNKTFIHALYQGKVDVDILIVV